MTHKGTNGAVVDTTSYTRDANGNVTHADLPGGGQFNYAYDARNRLTQVQQLKAAAPAAQWITVSYGYDNLNRQVLTTDGLSNQWLTTYNTLGLVQDQIEPSTAGQTDIGDRRFTSIYNAAGLVTNSIQPANVQVNYTYDELARVVLESAAVTAVSAAGTASFGYDAAGRMTSFSAPQGDVSLTYDDRNLLVSASGEGVASSFTYDAAGRMTKRTVAAGESQYQWDVAGRLVADTEPLTNTTRTYTWNTANQVTGVSYSAGGMQRAYTYDTAGRLVSDTLTGDNITQRQSQYGYDGAGRLASETISGTGSVVGQGVNSYTYDTAGRLLSWTAPSATTTSYGWDDSGNRTSNGAVTSTYDARNRLTGSSNGDSYTWSARGTMVSQTVGGQTSEYSFDGLGRMVSAAGVGVHYDALDRLAERSDGNGGWAQFSYSGTGLQPVSDGASLITRSPSGDTVAVKTGTAPGVSVVADRHGDVVATFNPTAGTIQGSVEFDPFGQTITTSGVQAGSVGYQGAYTDPTNGLIDMGARWYQPSTGRFTARDTIRPMLQSPISLNMYTYANDDPLGFFDPDGHQAVTPTPDACERTKQCSKQSQGEPWKRRPQPTKPSPPVRFDPKSYGKGGNQGPPRLGHGRDGDAANYLENWQTIVAGLTTDQIIDFVNTAGQLLRMCSENLNYCLDDIYRDGLGPDDYNIYRKGDPYVGAKLATLVVFNGLNEGVHSGAFVTNSNGELVVVDDQFTLLLPPEMNTTQLDTGSDILNGYIMSEGSYYSELGQAQARAQRKNHEPGWDGLVGGVSQNTTMRAGSTIVSYGLGDGTIFSPSGTSADRAGVISGNPSARTFVVNSEFMARAGQATSFAGVDGGGTLIIAPGDIEEMVRKGLITEVNHGRV